MTVYLGIDFGTSGARAIAIDCDGQIRGQAQHRFLSNASHHPAKGWQQTLFELLDQLPRQLRNATQAIAINGTSSTVLLCDGQGHPLTEPLMYHDQRGSAVEEQLRKLAPSGHLVQSATSSLAKLLWWSQQSYWAEAVYFLHQADWLGALLHGQWGVSDYHNALKLGYDLETLTYPSWLDSSWVRSLLPQVIEPGQVIAPVTRAMAQRFNFPVDCYVCAGTTDSIAAFLASGATQPGEAVTSLGSTLVLKCLSRQRVEDLSSGVYSHRLGQYWLPGGAANVGGAVLAHYFSDRELGSLSAQIDPSIVSPLDYYPLLTPGERFPTNDPALPPRLTPRPDDPVQFLHGLLESLSRIEALGYQQLAALGSDHVTTVYTAGGGAQNETWRLIRQRHLGIPVRRSPQTQAAYGSALLAYQGFKRSPGK